MSADHKRKADGNLSAGDEKRVKKQWRVPHKSDERSGAPPATIQYGDTGIFATCQRGKESKCIAELRDLYNAYAEIMYSPSSADDDHESAGNIENNILAELADIKKPRKAELFTHVRLNVQCVVFFKTASPVEPVSFVERICSDLAESRRPLSTRFTQRLTPVSLVGHASADGLEKVARQVLAPVFHTEPQQPHKFAIRPNMRNHNVSPRDMVIKQVATLVGPPHTVDLHHYDYLVLIEYYQHVCGVSVVTDAYERLKRFNLAELAQVTQDRLPTDGAKQTTFRADTS